MESFPDMTFFRNTPPPFKISRSPANPTAPPCTTTPSPPTTEPGSDSPLSSSADSPHLNTEPTTDETKTSSSFSSIKSPLPIYSSNTNGSSVTSSPFNPFRQTKCHLSFPKTPNLLNPTYPDPQKLDTALDIPGKVMAINKKIDNENGPRSQQPFECACCDYATNYYNNFMDHINSNHIESDEEG